jgi:hypothetical protein
MSYDTWKDRDFIAEANEYQRREGLLPDEICICAYCDGEMARPPVMSSHPMCTKCGDRQRGFAQERAQRKQGVA